MKKTSILFLMAIVMAGGWFAFSKKSKKNYQYTTVTCAVVPVISNQDWYKSDTKAPLFEGLDVL